MTLTGVRPVIIGLLISAAYIIGFQTLVENGSGANAIMILKAVILVAAGFGLLKLTKLNPVIFILLFGIAGIVLF